MDKESITFPEIIEKYNDILKRSRDLEYFVRDIELQKEMVQELKAFLLRIKNYKYQVIEQKDEDLANQFFHCQCVINASIASISIWIALKDNDHHKAWNHLIDAQEYLSYAFRASDNGYGLEDFKKRLNKIEEVIFPGFPLYNSIGLHFKGGTCSVCGEEFSECGHIEDMIYFGIVCKRLKIEEVDIDHTAIVENPKDRRCIITEFEFTPGKMYDYMTKKFLRDKSEENGKTMAGVFLKFSELDLF
jgi:hypothetical protein